MAEILDRQLELIIATPGVVSTTITSENIVAESMVITRSLCDGNFNMGGCIASSFEIQLIDVPPNTVQGKRITARAYETYNTENVICPNANLYPANDLYPGKYTTEKKIRYFFVGTVDTAERQSNRQIVKVTAYDDLYILGNKNVYTWFYNFALHSSDDVKISDLSSSLWSSQLIGLQVDGTPYGNNGNDKVSLFLSPTLAEKNYRGSLLAIDVLKSICELTGVFGYISEKGNFMVVDITNNALHPNTVVVSRYESLSFEEYETQAFDSIVLCYGDNKRYIYGRKTSSAQASCYYCKDNVIANCCKDSTTASCFGSNLAYKQSGRLLYEDYCYRPFTLKIDDNFVQDAIVPGCKVKIVTGFSTGDVQYVNSFVLKDRIAGIVNLTHEFSAEGEKVQTGYDSEAIQ